MRWAILAVALALSACATTCPTVPTVNVATSSLDQVYALRGRLVSDLSQGKITPQQALTLNAMLTSALADLHSGNSAEAESLIETVQKELP